MTFAAIVVFGYLLGACPWGYWLVRIFRGEDVRRQGSGGIGASNVWRAYGRRLGIPVVALDVLKGFVPALVGVLAVSHLCGILGGRGGDGRPRSPALLCVSRRAARWSRPAAACSSPSPPGLLSPSAASGSRCSALSRYTSVASVVAAVALPLLAFAIGYPVAVIVFAAVTGLAIVVLHRANLRRLRAGTENRFGLGARASPRAAAPHRRHVRRLGA